MKKLLYIALLLILIMGFDITVSNYVIRSQLEIIEEQQELIDYWKKEFVRLECKNDSIY